MKILTYVTDADNSNLKLLQQRLPVYLVPNYIAWCGSFYAKAYGVNEFIQPLPDDELIVVCDGYDVLPFNGCTIETLKTAIETHFDANKVTFNAETNCFPNAALANKYPDVSSKWRYLNAGLFAGRVRAVKKMYATALKDIVRVGYDQHALSLLFLERPDLLALDYRCQVFQALYSGRMGGKVNMSDFAIEAGIIRNKQFNSTPLLFHGNGLTDMTELMPFFDYCR
jgi:hypothetical protein